MVLKIAEMKTAHELVWAERKLFYRGLIAEMLHNKYEEEAKRVGWKTQESCQVKFKDLPEKNKEVMLAIAELVMEIKATQYYKLVLQWSREKENKAKEK